MGKAALYLIASISLSAGRNITSKKTASSFANFSQFFLSQTVLFLSAAILLAFSDLGAFSKISGLTAVYGVIYGGLLISSQWMFTLALKRGNTSVCSVVYSLGFIIPTVSGSIFWGEDFLPLHFLGLALALCVIFLSIKKEEGSKQVKKSFVPFILIAMLSSGGLGVMQKVQQKSPFPQEKSIFLVIAFSVAFLASLLAFAFSKKEGGMKKSFFIPPIITGICFGGANLCNTILAGLLDSAVFFPLQNISTILATTVLGIILFKEKLTLKTSLIILLSIAVVIIFSL